MSAYHFVDCLAIFRGVKAEIVGAQLKIDFPKFGVLAELANASKHFDLKRGPGAGLASPHFEIGLGAPFSDGIYWSDGPLSDAPEAVRVRFNGKIFDVLWHCEAALAAWEKVA